MTKFVLIPEAFSGNLSFVYNKGGLLVDFKVNSWDIKEPDLRGVLSVLPEYGTAYTFTQFATKYKYQFKSETIDLSFEVFWRMYGSPRDRFRCEPRWKKMTEEKRYWILVNLECYNRYCSRNPNYSKLTPYEYLTAHTEDNWDKVKEYDTKKDVFKM